MRNAMLAIGLACLVTTTVVVSASGSAAHHVSVGLEKRSHDCTSAAPPNDNTSIFVSSEPGLLLPPSIRMARDCDGSNETVGGYIIQSDNHDGDCRTLISLAWRWLPICIRGELHQAMWSALDLVPDFKHEVRPSHD